MKRLIALGSVAIIAILLLTQYGRSNENKKSKTAKGTTHMTRKTTDSGLSYEIIKEGTGASPQRGQQVTVHYTGWLDENGKPGKKFDSSVDRGEPFKFTIGIGQVIEGWDEGVLLMKVGEKRRLIIPPHLGYGAQGAGDVIPPNATLIFDIELLNIE